MTNRDADNELLTFFDDEPMTEASRTDVTTPEQTWKIIVIDDELEVHHLTKLVLSDFEFEGRRLEFVSAYSEADAHRVLEANPDAAIALLDVVMERDDSGLRIVRHIREQLGYGAMRIVLRTGQPGQAPERYVIASYDINDYKEKTELTAQKLFTTVMAALRSYRDIRTIETNKLGLEQIIHASSDLFKLKSMNKFASGVLTQLTSLLNLHKNSLHCNSFAVAKGQEEIYILAATGDYEAEAYSRIQEAVPSHVLACVESAFREKKGNYFDNRFTCYFQGKSGRENVIYFEGDAKLNEWNRYLIDIYCSNVSVAFDNLYLNEEIELTQKEIIFTLGELAESRSMETGQHVKRVAEYAKVLALGCGLDEAEAETIKLASSMHDVGKVAVPDAILNKPGKLTDEEFDVIKQHTSQGFAMLNHSNRDIIRAAAIIAHEHHEKYNGTGYPNGLAGEDIHLYGRIVALADVFDALGSERVYKRAWPLEDILAYFRQESGRHFDPRLVDIFFANLDELLRIRDRYADPA